MMKRAGRAWLRLRKALHQRLHQRSRGEARLLFVIGCQRSGTTLMQEIFDGDLNASVYPERSVLTRGDEAHGIRLDPLPRVARVVEGDPAALVVLKPLVETQNILSLLEHFPRAKALFLYRHYEDVASSDLQRFGTGSGVKNLLPIVNGNVSDWRAQRVPQDALAEVRGRFSPDMSPHDAAALFWFVRNSLYFDLALEANPAVRLCRYETLVSEPLRVMRGVYAFLGTSCEFPAAAVAGVHAGSVRKGSRIALSPDVKALCDSMLERLDSGFERQEALSRHGGPT
jgi:hypothetical protein